MEFRLLYQGELLGASRSDTRAKHKHAIRRVFHPQLRRLWRSHEGLGRMAWQIALTDFGDQKQKNPQLEYPPHSEEKWTDRGFEFLGGQWERGGFRFVPLVTEDLALSCSIDVLFLRPEEKRFIFNRGDLDAKVKTIFDALKIPVNLEEAGGQGPQDDEDPFFCLLADDKLVSEVKISSDELLSLPGDREPKANDSFLVIHVRLKPRKMANYSWVFE